jgi:hypothetical protein
MQSASRLQSAKIRVIRVLKNKLAQQAKKKSVAQLAPRNGAKKQSEAIFQRNLRQDMSCLYIRWTTSCWQTVKIRVTRVIRVLKNKLAQQAKKKSVAQLAPRNGAKKQSEAIFQRHLRQDMSCLYIRWTTSCWQTVKIRVTRAIRVLKNALHSGAKSNPQPIQSVAQRRKSANPQPFPASR